MADKIVREYNFVSGPETSTQPTSGAPTVDADLITKGYADSHYAALVPTIITGTRASPTAITALGGITFSGSQKEAVAFVKGTGAGTTNVTVNPRISVGTTFGQKLKICQRSATDFLKFQDGNGLDLDGDWLGDDASRELNLWWDGTNWKEEGRR
jgi:hypothetical protein